MPTPLLFRSASQTFVARITKDGAPAHKLATGGLHGGSFFEKGWCVTEFKWMHFVRVDPDTGDHLFKHCSKAKPTVCQANALVANADCYVKAEGGFKDDQKLKPHRLSKGVHDKTMMYCDLSVGICSCFLGVLVVRRKNTATTIGAQRRPIP